MVQGLNVFNLSTKVSMTNTHYSFPSDQYFSKTFDRFVKCQAEHIFKFQQNNSSIYINILTRKYIVTLSNTYITFYSFCDRDVTSNSEQNKLCNNLILFQTIMECLRSATIYQLTDSQFMECLQRMPYSEMMQPNGRSSNSIQVNRRWGPPHFP